MSHPSESETPHDDSALDEIVREAGEILVTPQPKHLEQLRKAVLSRLTVERSRHWRLARRSILATGSVAAAVMLGIVVWQSQHSVSLAEVSQALRERPWIHAKAKEPRVSGEWWLSLTREVSARRDDEFAIFDDHRLGVRYEYDPQEKKLYRVPRSDRKEFGSVGALFRAILGGREFGGSELGGDEIVARSRRKINEENRTWIEYELTLRRHSSLSLKDAISAKMVLRVDPRSHLPATMKLKQLDDRSRKPGQPKQEVEFVLDYPEEGPVDVYSLGVPRTAEVVDRVPRDDAKRVVSVVNSCLDNFDPYFAIVTAEVPKRNSTQRVKCVVWRKGKQVRVEHCMFRANWTRPDPPPPNADLVAWWKKRLRQYKRVPTLISDGKTVYYVDLEEYNRDGKVTWQAAKRIRRHEPLSEHHLSIVRGNFAEFYAFRRLGISRRWGIELDPNPDRGPAGTVLVRVSNSSYWLDPTRSYSARRIEFSFENARPSTYELDHFQQTPRGIWFPALARRKNCIDSDDDGTFRGDIVTRFYLDFQAELPDDLFQPVDTN